MMPTTMILIVMVDYATADYYANADESNVLVSKTAIPDNDDDDDKNNDDDEDDERG